MNTPDTFQYLGDGVYVKFCGYGIFNDFRFDLMANDHQNPTDQIALESGVVVELLRFIKSSIHEEDFNAIMSRVK